jgi:hypothetical protein
LRQIVLQRASLIPVPQGAMTGGLLVDADVLSEAAKAIPPRQRS